MPSDESPPGSVHRLLRWQRLALYLAGAVLLLTGGLWLLVHYSVGAGAGALPHPLEAWSLRLHGLAAFAGLFVLGVLNNGLDHVNIDSFLKILIRGVILLAALVINVYAQRWRDRAVE